MVDVPEKIWAASVTDTYGEWQTTTDGLPRPTEYTRSDLVAELAAENERLAGARVVTLEWRGTEGVWAKADALFGATYRITEYAGMAKPFKLETVGFVGPHGHYGTLDDAKAAAQADYERRILSALAEPAGEAEPVAWRYRYNGKWYVCDSEAVARLGWDVTPLYTTPPDASAIREALEAIRALSGLDGELCKASATIMSRMADIHQTADAALAGAKP